MSNIEIKTSEDIEGRGKAAAEGSEEGSVRSEESGKKRGTDTTEEMTKKELIEKLKDAEKKAQENYDLYMRTYAEMENVKRRGAKEREELAKFANESLIKETLPVIDSLEKALAHAQDGNSSSGLIEGIEMTLNNLMTILEKAGLKEVEAMGKPFDPHFHESISMQADDTVPPKHVILDLQKGYLLNGRLIRPSMVVISQATSDTKDDDQEKT